MQDKIKSITGRIEQLEKKFTELTRELRTILWEDDQVSARILHADMDYIEKQLVTASFVNCTPHTIAIEGIGDLPPSGILPRVTHSFEDCLPLNGVRVRQKLGAGYVMGLPDPVEGLTFIVSGMVRDALSHSDALSALPEFQSRPDVYAPDTGPDAIRNEKGHIVAVLGLVQ